MTISSAKVPDCEAVLKSIANRRDEVLQLVASSRATWRAQVIDLVGLRLPDHAFDFYGFWLYLSAHERSMLDGLAGIRPGLLFDWFEAPLSALMPGRDVRLHGRFACTPPEMLHALWGGSDGLHWGLWYDSDDAKPQVTAFYARDGGGIWVEPGTLLAVVLQQIDSAIDLNREYEPDQDTDRYIAQLLGLRSLVRAFDCAAPPPSMPGPRLPTYDEVGVQFDPADRLLQRAHDETICDAITNDRPVVEEWVREARAALTAGAPQLALALGRDLHWLGDSKQLHHQRWAAELMSCAHEALGNPAIAAIARVHSMSARFHGGISVYPG